MQVQTPTSTKVADYHRQGDAAFCPVCLMLPPTLKEKAEANSHLRDYLHMIPLEVIGVPQYVDALNRSHRNLHDPNLIYPVAENIFVHIYPDHNDSRDFYMVVEPGMALKLDTVMEEVETRLVDLVHELDGVVNQDRSQLLLNSLAKVCTVGNGNHGNHKNGNSKRGSRVILDSEHMEALRYVIVRDKEGLGPLQPLILDTNIEDISCSGTGTLFVEHKTFGSLKSNITFNTAADLDSFVMRLSEKIGKPVTFRDPIVDATLPDGSRVNIVFGEDLSKRGSNFTIRKFSVTPMSIIDLVQGNTLTYQARGIPLIDARRGDEHFLQRRDCVRENYPSERFDHFYPTYSKDRQY
ncbi:MAG: type II/IV secretion system ATPase subunit [Chloroflexi bacterium]|nr:type II/IV secretion system ATPase subunit [Chloroflexota bacterium]